MPTNQSAKPALLFLHGFPLGPEMWKKQKESFEAEGYQVIAADVRLEGQRTGDGLPEPVTMEQMAQAALSEAEAAGAQRFVAVGFSMGGYVAFSIAEQAPERFAGLVLVDTRAEADTEEGKAGRREMAAKVLREGARAAAEAMVGKLLSPDTLRNNEAVAAEVERIILSTSPTAIASAALGMAVRQDRTAMLPTIQAPTLVIVGEEDAITPPDIARGIAEAIPGAELAVIPKAGHLSNMEQPQAFNEALSAWLRRI